MKEHDLRFAKFLLLINGGVPLLLLGWDACRHKLGANPVNFAIHTTGMLALVFLLLTLLVTPLRKITGLNWLIFSRRTLGLYAFFYASLHFLIFFSLDRSFSVSGTLSEMLKRKYLFVGLTGLLVMGPLALTSTNAMIKRLGGNAGAADRLAYVAALAGVIHYYMQVKADVRHPLAFAAVLALLLGYRLVASLRQPGSPAGSRRQPSRRIDDFQIASWALLRTNKNGAVPQGTAPLNLSVFYIFGALVAIHGVSTGCRRLGGGRATVPVIL